MYLAHYTRPDIAIAVLYLARFVSSLAANKFARVVDVIQYLKGTSWYGFQVALFKSVHSRLIATQISRPVPRLVDLSLGML
jgi:hypothetical protein